MPVRLFSGARGTRVSFHMLHRTDNARVKQQLYCPVDERVIERKDIVKGYEFRKGEYVRAERPVQVQRTVLPGPSSMAVWSEATRTMIYNKILRNN